MQRIRYPKGCIGAWSPSAPRQPLRGLEYYDWSGFRNHGTLTNMDASDWVIHDGLPALNFDGVNDYVDCGDTGFLPQFTISVWCCPSALTDAYQCLVSRGAVFDSDSNYTLGLRYRNLNSQNRIVPRFTNGGTIYGTEWEAIDNDLSGWQNIGYTFDGTTIKAYQNGIRLTNLVAGTDTPSVGPTDGGQNTKIGSPDTTDGTDDPFKGQIGCVHIFNRALPDAALRFLGTRRGITCPTSQRTVMFGGATSIGGPFPHHIRRSNAMTGGMSC